MAGRLNPEPYLYPTCAHVRKHGPGGWNNYQKYRQWLRDEFAFRCVYCLERERWRDMRESFHIDHFEPQKCNSHLSATYTNLLYLCPACNNLKRDKTLPDPCVHGLGMCLRVHRDGRIDGLNKEGLKIIDKLALADPRAVERRSLIIGMVTALAKTDWNLLKRLMGYPDDLPNLAAEPRPKTNSLPDGVNNSYFVLRARGELRESYYFSSGIPPPKFFGS
jgi:hypothetical protein